MADEAKPADVTTTPAPSAETKVETVESKEGSQVEAEVKASEVKPEAEKTSEQKVVVPEKYELKMPEGSLLDPSRIEQIAQFAKEQEMSNEEAQGVLEAEHEAVASFVEGQQAAFEKQTQAWFEECQNDKDVGGAAFKENAEVAKRAIDYLFDAETKKILNETGWGNHPSLFKGFVRLGRMLKEDNLVLSSQPAPGSKKSKEEVLYGSSNN